MTEAAKPEKIKIFNAATGKTEEVEKVIKTDAEWKKILTSEQFRIMRLKGTEQAFTQTCPLPPKGESGIYQCAGCGTDLFKYNSKFESGTGWPSFLEPVSGLNVKLIPDNSFGMRRSEVACARCDAHLGHVFDDGPPATGKRYCINTLALKLALTSSLSIFCLPIKCSNGKIKIVKIYSCLLNTNKAYLKIIASIFFLSFAFFSSSQSFAEDQIPHTTVIKDDVTTEVTCAVKDYTPKEAQDLCLSCTEKSWRGVSKSDVSSSSKVVEVAILSTGKGTEFRHWEPQDIALVVDGKKIKPCGKDKFYVPKESAVKDIAVATFVGLGSQQEEDASCHEGGEKRGQTAKAIDRAGMAAGLGLLVSSSKGEITGLKARFKIPGGQDALKSAKVEAKLLNTDTHKSMTVDAKMKYAASVSQAASNAVPSQTFNVAR